MGVKSTSSHPTNTKKADGHLLEYYRQDFGAGGGASVGSQVTVDFLIIGGGGGGGAGEAVAARRVGGGGGAGGYRVSYSSETPGGPSTSNESAITMLTGTTYTITVGGGGAGGTGNDGTLSNRQGVSGGVSSVSGT